MATISKTVEILFGGKNEVSKTIDTIGKDLGGLQDMTSKLTDPLAKVGESILKLDAALAALAVGGIALAIKTAGDFGGKFGEITTLISDTGAPIDAFRKSILEYSLTSVKSIDQINQAIYTAVSAGVDYSKSLEFIAASEKLSVAGRSDLGDTTKALASTLNAYGAGTDQATKYSDMMFTTVKLGLTTMTELSTQLANVTGLAASAGVPFETLSAAVAALTVAGLPTGQALTGIKAALTNIIKPTKEAEETAQSLGIQFNATALKTKGFETVLWEAWKATGGSTEKMAQLFGSVEALNSVLILSSDKTGKFKEDLKAMGDAAGSTQVAYDKVVNEFGNINQRLVNSFKVTLIEIGDKLMPNYGKIAEALGDLLKGVKVGVDSGAFDPLFKLLDEAGAELATWLSGVAKALPEAFGKLDFTGLINSLKALGSAFGSYLDGLDLTKPDDLASAMQTVIDIISGLIRVTGTMADAFRPFVVQIVEFLQVMAKGGPEADKATGSVLAFAMAIQTFGLGLAGAILLIDKYSLSISGLFNTVAGGAIVMWNGLEILFSLIKGGFLELEQQIVSWLDVSTLGMIPGLGALKTQITEQMEATKNSILQNGMEAGAGLDQLVKGFGQLGSESGKSSEKVADLGKGLAALPKFTGTAIDIYDQAALNKMMGIKTELSTIPDSWTILVQSDVTGLKTLTTELDALPGEKVVGIKYMADGSNYKVLEEIDAKYYALSAHKPISLNIIEQSPDWAEPTLEQISKITSGLNDIPDSKTVKIIAFAVGKNGNELVEELLPDGTTQIVEIMPTINQPSAAKTKEELKAIKDEKHEIDIKIKLAQIDVDRLKVQADTIGKAMEWKGKIDLAEVEGTMKILEQGAKNIGIAIESTGTTISSLVGEYAKTTDWSKESKIEALMKLEEDRRQSTFNSQRSLTEAQIKYLDARTEAMKKNQSLITIKGEGLQPHLEAFMFEILKAIQVRANAEGAAFLTGI